MLRRKEFLLYMQKEINDMNMTVYHCLWLIGSAILLIMLLGSLLSYIEKQDCICARLTSEEQEFVIDDRLRSFHEGIDQQSGVFIRSSSFCRHGKSIQLTIYPDNGTYKGKVIY